VQVVREVTLAPAEVSELLLNLQKTNELLESLLKAWSEFYPLAEDEDAYVGDTVTVPASSVVTVTYTLKEGYKFYVSRVYVDAAADVAYSWDFNYLLGPTYEYTKTLEGNEHEFQRRLVAKGGSRIVLTITNTSTKAYNLDITLRMWARRIS
jgi:hypothetical protein